jgi:hypothetical protein
MANHFSVVHHCLQGLDFRWTCTMAPYYAFLSALPQVFKDFSVQMLQGYCHPMQNNDEPNAQFEARLSQISIYAMDNSPKPQQFLPLA